MRSSLSSFALRVGIHLPRAAQASPPQRAIHSRANFALGNPTSRTVLARKIISWIRPLRCQPFGQGYLETDDSRSVTAPEVYRPKISVANWTPTCHPASMAAHPLLATCASQGPSWQPAYPWFKAGGQRESPGDKTMYARSLRFVWVAFFTLCLPALVTAAGPFTLSTMPRVDVHAHIQPSWEVIDEYVELRDALKKEHDVEMAMWISLNGPPPDLQELERRYHGRFLWAIRDYKISDGLNFSPEELEEWHKRGVAGFKFYPGWQPGVRIDRPEYEPVFSKMEEIGMVAASPHVANPCGTFGRRTSGWIPDPVVYWQHQRAWENVLQRHPKLVVVNAHMLWLCYSDEQLDYLRYMLTTYPNLNVDIATTPEFLYYVNRENLRDLMLNFSDRILFGTDMGTKWFAPDLGGGADNLAIRQDLWVKRVV